MRMEAFNRWAVTAIAFLASVAGSSLAVGQDLGDEWQSLTTAKWKIVFPAPELENLIERHQLRKNVNSSHDHEVAFWVDAISSYPKAVIHYLKAHADLAFRSRPDPRSIIDGGFFQEKTVKFDSLKKDRNRLGRVRWRLFHFDDVNCVGFSQTWGDVDPRMAGNQMIYGYYCAEPRQPLPDELARIVVAAIDIGKNKDSRKSFPGKSTSTPGSRSSQSTAARDNTKDSKKQFLVKSTGSSDGLWAGTGTSESGTCRAPTRKYGRIQSIHVELIIRELEITGRVTKAYHGSSPLLVDAFIRGIASESGEFNLQFGDSILGAELVLQGRLPREGDRASGKWNTYNCRGTLSLTRISP